MGVSPAASPILVTGVGRSGTTFVGRILAREPGIFYYHEPFLNHSRAGFFRWQDQHVFSNMNGSDPALEQQIAGLLGFRFRLIADWREHTTLKDRTKALAWWAVARMARWRKMRPLIKDPSVLRSVGWLHERFGFMPVLMIRHPAAVVHSFMRQGWHFRVEDFVQRLTLRDGPLETWVDELRDMHLETLSPVEGIALLWKLGNMIVLHESARHPDWLVLRHEDLTEDPVTQMQRVFGYLGLPFSGNSERRICDMTGPHNPVIDPRNSMSIRRDVRQLNELWREGLSDQDKEAIRRITEPVASRFYTTADWG